MKKDLNLKTIIAQGIIIAFLANCLGPIPDARADGFILPAPGQMVALSPAFSPTVLKGIKLDPKNPFRFHFFIDRGDSSLSQGELKQESAKLIKYFLASLTIPEKDLWVNLSPYEKDRIVPREFGQTEMGRDLLAQDYLLKQITASLIYPESQLGKEFWAKVYAQAQAKYGTTNIPINTFNKVWIVPEKAVVYENAGVAFVLENHLKVMLEQDYLSMEKHNLPCTVRYRVRGSSKDINAIGSQIVRQIVLPALTKEVNEGKNFSQLRQVFYSLILATWYKKKIKDSILNKVYSNRNRIGGVNVSAGDKDKIYQEYLKAFKKGVYNYIKEEPDQITGQTIPRKYFSGGMLLNMDEAMVTIDPAHATFREKEEIFTNNSITELTGDLAMLNRRQAIAGIATGTVAALLGGYGVFRFSHKSHSNLPNLLSNNNIPEVDRMTLLLQNVFQKYTDDLKNNKVPSDPNEELKYLMKPILQEIDPTGQNSNKVSLLPILLDKLYEENGKFCHISQGYAFINGSLRKVYICTIGDRVGLPKGFPPQIPGYQYQGKFTLIKNVKQYPTGLLPDSDGESSLDGIVLFEDPKYIKDMWQILQAYANYTDDQLRAKMIEPKIPKDIFRIMIVLLLRKEFPNITSMSEENFLNQAFDIDLNISALHEIEHQRQKDLGLFPKDITENEMIIRAERGAGYASAIYGSPYFGLISILKWFSVHTQHNESALRITHELTEVLDAQQISVPEEFKGERRIRFLLAQIVNLDRERLRQVLEEAREIGDKKDQAMFASMRRWLPLVALGTGIAVYHHEDLRKQNLLEQYIQTIPTTGVMARTDVENIDKYIQTADKEEFSSMTMYHVAEIASQEFASPNPYAQNWARKIFLRLLENGNTHAQLNLKNQLDKLNPYPRNPVDIGWFSPLMSIASNDNNRAKTNDNEIFPLDRYPITYPALDKTEVNNWQKFEYMRYRNLLGEAYPEPAPTIMERAGNAITDALTPQVHKMAFYNQDVTRLTPQMKKEYVEELKKVFRKDSVEVYRIEALEALERLMSEKDFNVLLEEGLKSSNLFVRQGSALRYIYHINVQDIPFFNEILSKETDPLTKKILEGGIRAAERKSNRATKADRAMTVKQAMMLFIAITGISGAVYYRWDNRHPQGIILKNLIQVAEQSPDINELHRLYDGTDNLELKKSILNSKSLDADFLHQKTLEILQILKYEETAINRKENIARKLRSAKLARIYSGPLPLIFRPVFKDYVDLLRVIALNHNTLPVTEKLIFERDDVFFKIPESSTYEYSFSPILAAVDLQTFKKSLPFLSFDQKSTILGGREDAENAAIIKYYFGELNNSVAPYFIYGPPDRVKIILSNSNSNPAMLNRLDKSQLTQKGGIDLNPAQMSMQVKKEGQDFKFNFNGTEIDAAQVTGATFTIRTMTPVTNLPQILGLNLSKS